MRSKQLSSPWMEGEVDLEGEGEGQHEGRKWNTRGVGSQAYGTVALNRST